jgi:putative redox protein
MVKALIHKAHYATQISSATNTLIADEPISHGGTGKGFAPMELLAASLAACTSITLRMYADRKEWDLESIEVMVDIERNNDISTFKRTIDLKGNFTEEQTHKLLDIANHCPIHKILNSSISIHTTLS